MKAYKMYNGTEKRFTHIVMAATEERAQELVPGTEAKYPQDFPTVVTESVMDRRDASGYLFAYGNFSVWFCNKKQGEYDKNYYVNWDQSLTGTFDTLGEAIARAKRGE